MAVHNDCYWSVVGEGHLHISTENTCLDGLAEQLGKARAEAFIHRHGEFGTRSVDVARTVTFACACHQGELADDKDAGIGIVDNGQVHNATRIGEDAHLHNLMAQVINIFISVAVLDAEQDKESATYLAVATAVDIDRSILNSLDDSSGIGRILPYAVRTNPFFLALSTVSSR